MALHPRDRMLWRETHPDEPADIEMADGGVFEVADVRLEVIHAPGHTPGSVCLYCEDLDAVSRVTSCWPTGRPRRTTSSPTSPGSSPRSGSTC